MNFLSTFLSRNNRQWLNYLIDEVEKWDIKTHLIVKEFFMKDNISYEKYKLVLAP